jgi:hypothetical protein
MKTLAPVSHSIRQSPTTFSSVAASGSKILASGSPCEDLLLFARVADHTVQVRRTSENPSQGDRHQTKLSVYSSIHRLRAFFCSGVSARSKVENRARATLEHAHAHKQCENLSLPANLFSSRLRRGLAEQIQLYHTGIGAFVELQICNLKRQRSVGWFWSGTSQLNEDLLGTRIEDNGCNLKQW